MRAVVTGGAGFIGSHLIEALARRGADIVCVERRGASRRWLADIDLTWLECGVDDEAALARAFDGADVVFHLAGLTEARSAAEFHGVNTEGTERVLRAAARHNGRAPHVILMSSLAAIGPCKNGEPLRPETAPRPLSAYGQSKLEAEVLMHAYADRVPGTIVRLPSVYGPRERGVLKFFKLVQRGIALGIGSWDRELSMIYVKDVVQGLLAIADRRVSGVPTYCLAHPEIISWRRFADTVGQALNRRPRLVSLPATAARVVALGAELYAALRGHAAVLNRGRVREMTQQRWVCDPTRAMRELGFAPQFAISRGIPETAVWYREAQWL
ncbi:MAG TPA: NAD(P)-dependent oxidoreductase [Gemmatimonadales bacterium]|nr:NAD(P)-dependent oxidoreductase [Gemmatimonadales bacterium]